MPCAVWSAVPQSPIAQSLRALMAANSSSRQGLQLVAKFVSVFTAALQRIASQPDNALFRKIKLDPMMVRPNRLQKFFLCLACL